MMVLRKRILVLFAICIGLLSYISAQVQVEGYVFEAHNRGYLFGADVIIKNKNTRVLVLSTNTDESGVWKATLEPNTLYEAEIVKKDFETVNYAFNTADAKENKLFLKIEAIREAGYIFDATLAEERENINLNTLGIEGAQIEVYNRTTAKEELVLKDHPHPNFQVTLKKGNHYTILIRKDGFLAKRIEAFVNVKGCVLCIDGVSELTPGVTDNISAATGLGTLLANIELQKVAVGKSFEIKNINYDYNKWNIREDAAQILDNVINVFQDNPGLELELGSHTDARGNDEYNMDLSQKRAFAAMTYLLNKGIDSSRISYKGYGETVIKNRCKNNITCSDKEHEENRRTELKITGIRKKESETWLPLSRMIVEEEFEKEMFKSVPSKNIPTKTTTPSKSKSQKSGKGPNQEMIEQDQSLNQTIDTMPEIKSNSSAATSDNTTSNSEPKTESYNVVAGSFLVPSNADKLIDKLVKLGYKFTTKKILADSEFYSVVVNSFDQEDEAKNLVSQLKAKKIDCFIKINP